MLLKQLREEMKPEMSKKFLDWIETQATKDKTVVEIGTGYSLA